MNILIEGTREDDKWAEEEFYDIYNTDISEVIAEWLDDNEFQGYTHVSVWVMDKHTGEWEEEDAGSFSKMVQQYSKKEVA